jgi:hypothetical protein
MGKNKGQRRRAKSVAPVVQESPPIEAVAILASRNLIGPLIVFLALLALYVASLAPSVMGGDSGELTTAALTGGVPHPPGYPLFAMLARLFAALPLGHSPAWRVNLLSAVSTAGAAALLCATVRLWTRELASGLVAAVLFGTNSVVWRHATSTEVFGLNAFFVALAFLLWLCVERTAARRFVFALCFACGLAMCNHHTFVFVGAPLVLRSLWIARRNLGAGGTTLALALGLLGLLPYGYLVIASGSNAAVTWGDQTTLDGFLTHVLRRNYGTFSMGRAGKGGAFVSEGTFLPTLWQMLGHAFPRLLWIGPPLAILGFARAGKDRHERRPVHVLLGCLLFYVGTFCSLSNLSTDRELYLSVLARFCIQSDLMLALAAGLGFTWLARAVRTRLTVVERHARLLPLCAALLFGAATAAHAGETSQRHNRVFSDFVTTAFASLPKNAIVITMGDHLTGSVFYFREIERLRPDVIHLDRELLGFPWYGQRKRRLFPDLHLPDGGYGLGGWNIKRLLDGNPTRPVVVIDRLEKWDASWKNGYKLMTTGLIQLLVPLSQYPTYEEWLERDRKAIAGYDVVPALAARDGSWEHMLGQLAMTTQSGRAHVALLFSTENGNAPAPARTAVSLLEDVVAKAGGDDALGIPGRPGLRPLPIGPTVWKDLGIGYDILSRSDASYVPRIAIAFGKFVERADPDDVDLPPVRQYVEQHPNTHPRPR